MQEKKGNLKEQKSSTDTIQVYDLSIKVKFSTAKYIDNITQELRFKIAFSFEVKQNGYERSTIKNNWKENSK